MEGPRERRAPGSGLNPGPSAKGWMSVVSSGDRALPVSAADLTGRQ